MRAFSRDALEQYVPVIQEEVRAAVRDWLQRDPCVLVYPEMKRLMFRIAMMCMCLCMCLRVCVWGCVCLCVGACENMLAKPFRLPSVLASQTRR